MSGSIRVIDVLNGHLVILDSEDYGSAGIKRAAFAATLEDIPSAIAVVKAKEALDDHRGASKQRSLFTLYDTTPFPSPAPLRDDPKPGGMSFRKLVAKARGGFKC